MRNTDKLNDAQLDKNEEKDNSMEVSIIDKRIG